MKRPAAFLAAAAAVVALPIVASVTLAQQPPPPAPAIPHFTNFGSGSCASDVTSNMQTFLNAAADNSTVTLAYHACYEIDGILTIQNRTGLTINANGATFKTTVPVNNTSKHPFFYLLSNTHLTIKNLNIVGAYDGSNGGPGREGAYGMILEDNHGVTLTGLSMLNIQGDFFTVQAPFDVPGGNLNTGIVVTNSTFTNCGYHGFVAEGVNGLTVTGNTFTNMAVDAMDFEYDIFSSGPPNPGSKIATYAAEDNVMVARNTWNNWGADWFASIQPSNTPNSDGFLGVQEQNVFLTNNTLVPGSFGGSLADVEVVNPTTTSSIYHTRNIRITNNRTVGALVGTTGSSITSPFSASTALFQYTVGTYVGGNTIQLFDGFCPPAGNYFCNGGAYQPYLGAVTNSATYSTTVSNNKFQGALAPINTSQSTGPVDKQCGNSYGAHLENHDSAC
jgi:hypothetical protein